MFFIHKIFIINQIVLRILFCVNFQIQIYLLPFLQCYYIQGERHLGTSKSQQQF